MIDETNVQPRWLKDEQGKWFYGYYEPRSVVAIRCAECGSDQVHSQPVGGMKICRNCDRAVAVVFDYDAPPEIVRVDPPNGGRITHF